LCDADLVFGYVAKDYFADDAYYFLSFSYLFADGIVYVSLCEVIFDAYYVLFVAIAEDGESAFPTWEAQSFGKQLIK